MDTPTPAPEQTTVTVPTDGAKPVPEAPSTPFNELKGKDRESFLKDGKLPAKESTADQSADAATAKPGEQAAPTGANKQTASEPVDPAKKKGKGVKERTAELDAEIAEMNDRLRIRAELRKQLEASEPKPKADGPKDSSTPAKPETPKERYKRLAQHPDAPRSEEFDGNLDEWGAAMAGFVAEQIAREQISSALSARDESQGQQAAHMRELETVALRAAERVEAETAKDPSLVEKIHPKFRDLVPSRMMPDGQTIGPHHYAKDLIMFESEHPLALSAFYSGSEDGIAEWQRICALPPAQLAREIAIRDVSFRSSQAASQPALPAKPFTKTPEPPADLGKKPAGVIDKKKAAEGNFDAMWALLDEQEGKDTRRPSRR